jgi:hypothetical protein
MTSKNEDSLKIDAISIRDIGNLSIVELLMLQKLLRHRKPVVRHILFNEISQFLRSEQEKVMDLINLHDPPPGAQKFYRFLKSEKKFSSSSFYHSLDNLESKGLVKFNYDDKNKVVSVEATNYTEILNSTVLKHIIKFGLFEAEQNRILPNVIKEAIKLIERKKIGTMLYVWFSDIIDVEFVNTISMITDNLFLLSKKEVFENGIKFGLTNVHYSTLFNDIIRESDNFFDVVIISHYNKNDNLNGISRKTILKEAVRITKDNGIVIIYGFLPIPDINHGILNVFIKWVKNIYQDVIFFTEEQFKNELLNVGMQEVDVFTHKGHLFAIGKK